MWTWRMPILAVLPAFNIITLVIRCNMTFCSFSISLLTCKCTYIGVKVVFTVFYDCLRTKIKNSTQFAKFYSKEQNTSTDLHNITHNVCFTLFAKHYTQWFVKLYTHFHTLDTDKDCEVTSLSLQSPGLPMTTLMNELDNHIHQVWKHTCANLKTQHSGVL